MIGESANRVVVQEIRAILKLEPSIEAVNEVLTMHMGPDFILANISVDFVDSETVDRIENVIARVDMAIKQKHPEIKRVFVEAEKSSR